MGQKEDKDCVEVEWKELKASGDDPGCRYSHSCHLVPGTNEMIILGGDIDRKDCLLYNFEMNRWKRMRAPIGLAFHSSLYDASRDCFVVYGGQADASAINYDQGISAEFIFEVKVRESRVTWDPVETVGSGKKPKKRAGHIAILTPKGKMLIFGGRHFFIGHIHAYEYLQDIWEYDMEGRSWEEVEASSSSPRVPSGRAFHSGAMIKSQNAFLVYGGYDGSVDLGDFWRFSLETLQWREVNFENQSDIIGRSYHRIMVLENSFREESHLILGSGWYNDDIIVRKHSKKSLTSFWSLDLQSGKKWRQINIKDSERMYFDYSLIQYDDKVYIFGGTYRTYPSEREFEERDVMVMQALPSVDNKSMHVVTIPGFHINDHDLKERREFLNEYCTSKESVVSVRRIKCVGSALNICVMKILLQL